jgi:hypothetical protein
MIRRPCTSIPMQDRPANPVVNIGRYRSLPPAEIGGGARGRVRPGRSATDILPLVLSPHLLPTAGDMGIIPSLTLPDPVSGRAASSCAGFVTRNRQRRLFPFLAFDFKMF